MKIWIVVIRFLANAYSLEGQAVKCEAFYQLSTINHSSRQRSTVAGQPSTLSAIICLTICSRALSLLSSSGKLREMAWLRKALV